MHYKRARIIYNPTAGRELIKKNLAYILDTLEKAGYETSAYATTQKGDAVKEAKKAAQNEYDLIISAGGDGTLYEVVNGIAEQTNRPILGILPMGTSNDFARSIGVSKSLDKALEAIVKGRKKKVDIGKMNSKYFINIAGGGVLTELTYEAPSKLKTVLGQLAYYIQGIEKLPSLRPFRLEIEANGQKWKEESLIFLVANSRTVGGFEKLAPEASVNDGLFDVFMLKSCNLMELGRVMTLLIRGDHLKDPKIVHFKTDRLSVKTEEDILINLDGELGGQSPCEFSLLKEHIDVIVNE